LEEAIKHPLLEHVINVLLEACVFSLQNSEYEINIDETYIKNTGVVTEDDYKQLLTEFDNMNKNTKEMITTMMEAPASRFSRWERQFLAQMESWNKPYGDMQIKKIQSMYDRIYNGKVK